MSRHIGPFQSWHRDAEDIVHLALEPVCTLNSKELYLFLLIYEHLNLHLNQVYVEKHPGMKVPTFVRTDPVQIDCSLHL